MERHAAQAALELIHDDMTIGLGSGKAIEYLIEFISMTNFSNLKIVTNRMETAVLAQKRDLTVIPCWMVSKVDYTFDSVDYAVKDLYSLKNDDIVVVDDKILAEMADHFVEIVDRNNFAEILAPGFPIEVEVIQPAFSYTQRRLEELGASVAALNESNHPFLSSNGNYVIEAGFKNVEDLKALNDKIMAIPGVISTSVYTGSNAMALVYDQNGVETIS